MKKCPGLITRGFYIAIIRRIASLESASNSTDSYIPQRRSISIMQQYVYQGRGGGVTKHPAIGAGFKDEEIRYCTTAYYVKLESEGFCR